MKKLILALSLALTACGSGSSSPQDSGESQKNLSRLPDCDFRLADFSKLQGHYESLNEASLALMNWATSFSLNQNCKVNSNNLASNLGGNINLARHDRGQLEVALIKGDQK